MIFLMEDQLIIHSTNVYLIYTMCQALLGAESHKIEEDMVSAIEKLTAIELEDTYTNLEVKSVDSSVRRPWERLLALLLTNYITLNKLLNNSRSLFHH